MSLGWVHHLERQCHGCNEDFCLLTGSGTEACSREMGVLTFLAWAGSAVQERRVLAVYGRLTFTLAGAGGAVGRTIWSLHRTDRRTASGGRHDGCAAALAPVPLGPPPIAPLVALFRPAAGAPSLPPAAGTSARNANMAGTPRCGCSYPGGPAAAAPAAPSGAC